MMRRLENKVIVVAGAGGIGSELARRYASEGACVVLGDRDAAQARDVAEAIEAGGGHAVWQELDGADEASLRSLVETATGRFGGLDGIHLNYASFADGRLPEAVEIPLGVFDEVMNVNARGFFLGTRAAIPALVARGGGAIVYTSSGAAHATGDNRVAYAMSKAAIHALMRIVATRYGKDHIRANVIAPGIIMHPALEAAAGDWMAAWAFARMPTKRRLGNPTDIAAVGALLMSEEGAYITGQVISVDGGSSMRP